MSNHNHFANEISAITKSQPVETDAAEKPKNLKIIIDNGKDFLPKKEQPVTSTYNHSRINHMR